MACVAQAVLEFDEEVRAPWRPRLVTDIPDAAPGRSVRSLSSRTQSRIGACRPAVAPGAPASPVRRPRVRRAQQGPAVRPAPVGATSGGRPRVGRPAPVGLRLTRRARRLAVVLALAAAVALGSWISPLLGGEGGGLRLAGGSSVVVQSGDTLWSIASALGGEGDVRAVIHEIQRLNDLEGADLVPGQILQLP